MLVAIAHIACAMVTIGVLGFLTLMAGAWQSDRNKKRLLDHTASKLGVTLEQLDDVPQPRVLQVWTERYSDDHLSNRLADLCGIVQTAWGWLGAALQVFIFGVAIWMLYNEGPSRDGPSPGAVAWVAVIVQVVFTAIGAAFSLLCRVLTGRYPGEAKQARKLIAKFRADDEHPEADRRRRQSEDPLGA